MECKYRTKSSRKDPKGNDNGLGLADVAVSCPTFTLHIVKPFLSLCLSVDLPAHSHNQRLHSAPLDRRVQKRDEKKVIKRITGCIKLA